MLHTLLPALFHTKADAAIGTTKRAIQQAIEILRNTDSVVSGSRVSPISDDYEFGDEIERGRYGIVFEAHTKNTSRPHKVAIKRIAKTQIKTTGQRAIMQSEVDILRRFTPWSRNCLTLDETYEDKRYLYIVSELLEGRELFDHIVEEHSSFSEAVAARIMRQILGAISESHNVNIAHRDVKPENLRFRSLEGGMDSDLVLIDFGMSCELPLGELKHDQVGSLSYVAPEVLSGAHDRGCDIYSAGVILYILFTGTAPFAHCCDLTLKRMIQEGIPTSESRGRPAAQGLDGLNGGALHSISASGKYFLQQLMATDPLDRPDASTALKHPWLTEHAAHLTEPLPAQVLDSLRSFQRAERLKQAVLGVIASQLEPGEISNLEAQFAVLDRCDSGTVSLEDLQAVLDSHAKNCPRRTKLGTAANHENTAAEMMKVLDIDHDGRLSMNEFVAAAMRSSLYMQEDKLHAAFDEFDENGDGSISREELRRVLEKHGRPCSEAELDDMLNAYDIKGDSAIDFSEFLVMMRAGALS